MKELTNEMKAKYFMQHYKQYVNSNKGPCRLRDADGVDKLEWIELKPLEAISDEHAKGLHSILRLGNNEAGYETTWQDIKKAVINDGIDGLMLFDFYGHIIECYHYLQLNGFALCWNGYTVDQLIQAGWLQLTPNNG